MDPVLLVPRHERGSRLFRSTAQRFICGTKPDFGTSDLCVAIAYRVVATTIENQLPWITGADSNANGGTRFLGLTTMRMGFSVGNGTARVTAGSANNSIVSGQWHWIVANVARASNIDIYIDDMATPSGTAVVSGLSGDITSALFPHIGSYGGTNPLDKTRIACVAVLSGGTWNETARNDWKTNRGRYANLAAGTKANMIHYFEMSERSGNALDSVGTNHGVETNGPIRPAKRPL